MIPPRPWFTRPVLDDGIEGRPFVGRSYCVDATGSDVDLDDPPVAELIVRLVNAEPEIVAALEAAIYMLSPYSVGDSIADRERTVAQIRAALAKVRP